ncbi:Sodium / potassium ATPase beta chain [Popillia japonica]|uniref:Sodium / potassium ATPase beta chain n=1 Tax=Popillia japonica TaxID=7064 RepID=A0AAW1N3G2_POPJA
MYNRESSTYCNKSCKHWWLLVLHYITFLKTRKEPLFCKTDLLSTSTPALGIFPRLQQQVTSLIWYTRKKHHGIFPRLQQQVTSLIWYTRKKHHKESVTPETYIKIIDEFLKPYDNLSPSIYVDCKVTKPKSNQYCMFSRTDLGPCGKDGYGYKIDKPCIYLKLNKLRYWRPEYKSDETKPKKGINSTGRQTTDINSSRGPFFKDYFFPFDGSRWYRSPLIGIQFENLNRGFVIGVKCFAKASTTNLQNKLLHTATVFLYIDVN